MGQSWQHFANRREALFSFVGEKCCNTTILDPQQFKSVGVGQTFHSFVRATLTSFVGPTVFASQQMKTVGVGGNYPPFVVACLLFLQILALKSVGEVQLSVNHRRFFFIV